jgi:hypothetical protein
MDRYRKFWESSLDQLDEYLVDMQKKEKSHARKRR